MRTTKILLGIVLITVLAVGVYYYWQWRMEPSPAAAAGATKRGPGGAGGPRATPVVAAAATQGDVDVIVNGLGTVTPLRTVTVRSRVDGELVRVLFEEGQVVRQGQLLAEIDPRAFHVQLQQAEGQLARDRALLENARLDFERFYRVDESRSRANGGSGLGLAICRSIAAAHGGDIAASPSPLGGLRIAVSLPVAA